MGHGVPMFYSAMLLTLVNLLLRFVGTSFQVWISAALGPAGVGLLQLVLSVGSLALVAGMGGIRTAAMYLTAGELGQNRRENTPWVLSGCFRYSILFSVTVGLGLTFAAPWLAEHWIGDIRTAPALQLLGLCLPITCLSGVMSGYFTAANRIGTLAAVEVAEQLLSMAVTMGALKLWAGAEPGRACMAVVLGSCAGNGLTLVFLAVLRILEKQKPGPPVSMARRLRETALPLGAADVLKSGINTLENLMVPRRLALCTAVASPLAAFGMVSGMVFPVVMFPACILFGLAELLIPELARCHAAGSHRRIRYLARRGLRLAMVYGAVFGGLLWLLSDWLCQRLYGSPEAAGQLRRYALLVPMLYCDAITDAMTKGLGQQRANVRYNILTSFLDVLFLYLLLPKYGMEGYFVSFFLTHALNFGLSLRRLLSITGQRLPWRVPLLTAAAMGAGLLGGSWVSQPLLRGAAYLGILGSLLCLFGITGREDWTWLKGVIRPRKG